MRATKPPPTPASNGLALEATGQGLLRALERQRSYIPHFSFRDGQPHPRLCRRLRDFPKGLSPWQIAFFVTIENGWLSIAKLKCGI